METIVNPVGRNRHIMILVARTDNFCNVICGVWFLVETPTKRGDMCLVTNSISYCLSCLQEDV